MGGANGLLPRRDWKSLEASLVEELSLSVLQKTTPITGCTPMSSECVSAESKACTTLEPLSLPKFNLEQQFNKTH